MDGTRQECGCGERNPLVICPACGAAGQGYARFCRVCASRLPVADGRRRRLGASTFSFIPGGFFSGAMPYGGWLWSLSEDGTVYRLSPRAHAAPRVWAKLPSPHAGFTRPAIVVVKNAPVASAAGAINGPTLLAVDSAGVHAVSLVDGRTSVVCRPIPGREIVANLSAADSPYFRGLAAGETFVGMLVRSADGRDLRLHVHYFASEQAFEEPVRIADGPCVGPVARGTAIGLCTEEDLWIYDTLDQRVRSAPLPAGFEPYWQRPAHELQVPPGHVPFAIVTGVEGACGWIAGRLRGSPGLLRMDIDQQQHEFHAVRSGACVCQIATGGLCVNDGEQVEFFGDTRPAWRVSGPAPGMLVNFDGTSFAQFGRPGAGGSHVVTVFLDGAEPLSGTFQDAGCDGNSCAGIHWVDRQLIVSYLQLSADRAQRGLKCARWEAA